VAASVSDELHWAPSQAEMLIQALNRHDDRICMYLGDTKVTYVEVRSSISQFCQAFSQMGIGPGHGVAVLAANRPEVLYMQGANAISGCRTTALHPMGSLDDHAFILEDAGVETLIFDPRYFTERAAELAQRVPSLANLLALGPTEVGTDLFALATAYSAKSLVAPLLAPGTVTALAYTGGTTGSPKGVMATQRAFGYMTMIQMAEWQWPAETRFLVATPLSHAAAATFLPTLLHGGSLVVLPGFDPDAFFDAVAQYRITATMVVPTMLYVLLDHARFDTADLSSLETVFYGAAAISPTRLAEAIERSGPRYFQFYGQTEAPMTLCVLRKEEHLVDRPERLATCGRPVPWVQVRLLDPGGAPVERGEPGEICVRGPLVMDGYWNRPEQTAEAFTGGWLHTGDIAREDDEGYLTIVDRSKDMIISGGFNVYPREVEDVLSSHPAVAVAAVIGVPDDKWGEAVKAIVVRRPGATVEVAELIDLVKSSKGPIHAPKTVDFVDAIPVSPLGKPDKKALRRAYWQDRDRRV
jgi:fatty-acyl-CoA synthase